MDTAKEKDEFSSGLSKPVQRAMSSWLHFALLGRIITVAEFIKHFTIAKVITSLSPAVRGKVLCVCNGGGDAERAAKMKPEIVASTIASMLEDKLVTPDDICKEITTDHMVEVLPSQELYRLIFGKPEEKKRWLFDDKAKPASKTFMVEVHRVLLAEHLLGDGVETASGYVKIVGEGKIIHEQTPTRLLAAGTRDVLMRNREGKLYTDDDLLKVYAPHELIEYVDLADLFDPVVAVAELNKWVEAPKPEPKPEPAHAEPIEEAEPLGDDKRPTNKPPPPARETDAPEIDLEADNNASITLAVEGGASDPAKGSVDELESAFDNIVKPDALPPKINPPKPITGQHPNVPAPGQSASNKSVGSSGASPGRPSGRK